MDPYGPIWEQRIGGNELDYKFGVGVDVQNIHVQEYMLLIRKGIAKLRPQG